MANLARCPVCDDLVEPEHTVDYREDAATGELQLLHMECTADGVSRAQRLGRNRVPAPPGSWDDWNDEEGAQSGLDAFSRL